MFEAIIKGLISIVLFVCLIYVVLWFLASIGLALPAMVVQLM